MSTLLLLGAVLTSITQSPVDRTGEEALNALLDSMGQLPPSTMTINQMSREATSEYFYEGNALRIEWESRRCFRISVSSYWGDGALYVANGKSYSKDPLDLSQPVSLRDLGDSIVSSIPELAVKGDLQTVAAYFLDGSPSLSKLAPKESAVKYDSISRSIVIEKSPFGRLTVYVQLNKGRQLVDRIEYDNWDSKVAAHERYPDWVDLPKPGTLDIEVITYSNLGKRHRRGLFDTSPPKGVAVADERKKPSR